MIIYCDNAAKKVLIKADILGADRGVHRGQAGVLGRPGVGLCERGRHRGKMSHAHLCRWKWQTRVRDKPCDMLAACLVMPVGGSISVLLESMIMHPRILLVT